MLRAGPFAGRRGACTLILLMTLALLPVGSQAVDNAEETDHSKILAELPIEELIKVRVTSIATGSPQTTIEAPAVTSVIT